MVTKEDLKARIGGLEYELQEAEDAILEAIQLSHEFGPAVAVKRLRRHCMRRLTQLGQEIQPWYYRWNKETKRLEIIEE